MSIQQLGGTRHSSPLDDEMSYPLTNDEYQIIKENLSIDKFTNWESFLVTTAVTSLISAIAVASTTTFQSHITDKSGKETIELNVLAVVIIATYMAFALGGFIGFILSRINKTKAEKPMQRLDFKITSHLNKSE